MFDKNYPVPHARTMWSRKQSVCSAVSSASKGDDAEAFASGLQIYPSAITLRVRVLQVTKYEVDKHSPDLHASIWASFESKRSSTFITLSHVKGLILVQFLNHVLF